MPVIGRTRHRASAVPYMVRGIEAERNGRDGLLVIAGAAHTPDVGGVVGADRGLDRAVLEQALVAQPLHVGGRHQHDVDDVLPDDGADLVEELLAGAVAGPAAVGLALGAGPAQAGAHVGVLGVGDDEVLTAVLAGPDPGELLVQALHDGPLRVRPRAERSAASSIGGGCMAPVMIATASDIE